MPSKTTSCQKCIVSIVRLLIFQAFRAGSCLLVLFLVSTMVQISVVEGKWNILWLFCWFRLLKYEDSCFQNDILSIQKQQVLKFLISKKFELTILCGKSNGWGSVEKTFPTNRLFTAMSHGMPLFRAELKGFLSSRYLSGLPYHIPCWWFRYIWYKIMVLFISILK